MNSKTGRDENSIAEPTDAELDDLLADLLTRTKRMEQRLKDIEAGIREFSIADSDEECATCKPFSE